MINNEYALKEPSVDYSKTHILCLKFYLVHILTYPINSISFISDKKSEIRITKVLFNALLRDIKNH